MEEFIGKLFAVIIIIIVIIVIACLGGIIIWLIWPIVIPAVFPGLVENGTISGEIGLWPAICLTFLTAILIKSSSSSGKKK